MSVEMFFDQLAEHRYEPLLHRSSGTVRLDLRTGRKVDHWYLELDRGNVAVSRSNDPADCVIQAEHAVFEKIASGESNAMATLLRSEMSLDGDPGLVVSLQKLFPWPPPTVEQPALEDVTS